MLGWHSHVVLNLPRDKEVVSGDRMSGGTLPRKEVTEHPEP